MKSKPKYLKFQCNVIGTHIERDSGHSTSQEYTIYLAVKLFFVNHV